MPYRGGQAQPSQEPRKGFGGARDGLEGPNAQETWKVRRVTTTTGRGQDTFLGGELGPKYEKKRGTGGRPPAAQGPSQENQRFTASLLSHEPLFLKGA